MKTIAFAFRIIASDKETVIKFNGFKSASSSIWETKRIIIAYKSACFACA